MAKETRPITKEVIIAFIISYINDVTGSITLLFHSARRGSFVISMGLKSNEPILKRALLDTKLLLKSRNMVEIHIVYFEHLVDLA